MTYPTQQLTDLEKTALKRMYAYESEYCQAISLGELETVLRETVRPDFNIAETRALLRSLALKGLIDAPHLISED